MADDYYTILELPPDASQADIKKAYRRMALRWHPDKNSAADRAQAERRFRQIGEAYEVLSNPYRRNIYDRRWQESTVGSALVTFEFRDPTDVFRDFFNDPTVSWVEGEVAEWEALQVVGLPSLHQSTDKFHQVVITGAAIYVTTSSESSLESVTTLNKAALPKQH